MIDVDDFFRNPVGVFARHVAGAIGATLPEPEPEYFENPEPRRRRRGPASGAGALLDRISSNQSGVYVIIGPRGSAKTGFLLRLTEWMGRRRFSVGPIRGVNGEYRSVTRDIQVIELDDIDQLPPRSVVLMDDVTTLQGMNSRDYGQQVARKVQDKINLSRHDGGLALAMTAQNSASLNKYGLDADGIFFKAPGKVAMTLGHVVEREQLEDVMARVRAEFEKIPPARWKGHIYAVSEEYVGMLKYDRPRGIGR